MRIHHAARTLASKQSAAKEHIQHISAATSNRVLGTLFMTRQIFAALIIHRGARREQNIKRRASHGDGAIRRRPV